MSESGLCSSLASRLARDLKRKEFFKALCS
jgi:hypothetical protein